MKSHRRTAAALLMLLMLLTIASGCGGEKVTLSPGYEYLDRGDIQGAIKAFEKMIEEDRSGSEGWLGLAESYWASGEHEKALETLEEGLKSVEGEAADKLRELYDRIKASVTEAVDVTPVKPPEKEQEPEEIPGDRPDEEEPAEETDIEVGESGETHETVLTVDYTLLEQAVFSNHGELNRAYGSYTSKYNDLGWMVQYGDSALYCFYGYDGTLVNVDGVPYDDSKPNLVMISPASALIKGGETAEADDIAVLFGTALCQENVMDGGYTVVCTYKGSTINIDSDAAGHIDLETSLVQIYGG